jgi:hypothetical protein
MLKYDQFATETSEKFVDFEYVISELEKNVNVDGEEEVNNNQEDENEINDTNTNENQVDEEQISSIMSVDLKNLIKQELATGIDD